MLQLLESIKMANDEFDEKDYVDKLSSLSWYVEKTDDLINKKDTDGLSILDYAIQQNMRQVADHITKLYNDELPVKNCPWVTKDSVFHRRAVELDGELVSLKTRRDILRAQYSPKYGVGCCDKCSIGFLSYLVLCFLLPWNYAVTEAEISHGTTWTSQASPLKMYGIDRLFTIRLPHSTYSPLLIPVFLCVGGYIGMYFGWTTNWTNPFADCFLRVCSCGSVNKQKQEADLFDKQIQEINTAETTLKARFSFPCIQEVSKLTKAPKELQTFGLRKVDRSFWKGKPLYSALNRNYLRIECFGVKGRLQYYKIREWPAGFRENSTWRGSGSDAFGISPNVDSLEFKKACDETKVVAEMIRFNGNHVQCPMPETGRYFIQQCFIPPNYTENAFISYMDDHNGIPPPRSKVVFVVDPRAAVVHPEIAIKMITYPPDGHVLKESWSFVESTIAEAQVDLSLFGQSKTKVRAVK